MNTVIKVVLLRMFESWFHNHGQRPENLQHRKMIISITPGFRTVTREPPFFFVRDPYILQFSEDPYILNDVNV